MGSENIVERIPYCDYGGNYFVLHILVFVAVCDRGNYTKQCSESVLQRYDAEL